MIYFILLFLCPVLEIWAVLYLAHCPAQNSHITSPHTLGWLVAALMAQVCEVRVLASSPTCTEPLSARKPALASAAMAESELSPICPCGVTTLRFNLALHSSRMSSVCPGKSSSCFPCLSGLAHPPAIPRADTRNTLHPSLGPLAH